jgi:hypothetical protein
VVKVSNCEGQENREIGEDEAFYRLQQSLAVIESMNNRTNNRRAGTVLHKEATIGKDRVSIINYRDVGSGALLAITEPSCRDGQLTESKPSVRIMIIGGTGILRGDHHHALISDHSREISGV